MKNEKQARALNLNTLKTTAFEYINNITINQVICDFFCLFILFHWRSFIEFLLYRFLSLPPSRHNNIEQIELCVIWLISSSTSHSLSLMSDIFCVQSDCINDPIFFFVPLFTHAWCWLTTADTLSISSSIFALVTNHHFQVMSHLHPTNYARKALSDECLKNTGEWAAKSIN